MKSKPETNQSETISHTIASRIAGVILRVQTAFAEQMQRHTCDWSRRQQKAFLYLICILFGSLSLLSILTTRTYKSIGETVRNNRIKIPVKESNSSGIHITENELKQVQDYKMQNPHLSNDRPGLYDSLTCVEEMYYSQKK